MHEAARWTCRTTIAKYHGEWVEGDVPFEVIELDNMLMHGGVSFLWEAAIGNAGAGDLAYFDSATAAIGVGNGTTAEAATQTNLQGANRLRRIMDAGYPQHVDGTSSGAASVTFRSTFDTTQANFAWEEVGVFNNATDGSGRMLNRKVSPQGTKTSSSSWQVTMSISIS